LTVPNNLFKRREIQMSANLDERKLWLDLYAKMFRCLTWEQQLLNLQAEGRISGFFHAGRGQEGAQVGAVAALAEKDYLLYAHRGCGYLVARGMPLDVLFADFLGYVQGSTRGIGAGIVHIAWPSLGILGQSGTLGGSFNIAVGAALSSRVRETNQATLCFFGDGTANRGTFHEAANAAGVWKLPIVWFCENNGWAVSTRFEEGSSVKQIAGRATAYGMPGVIVDGQDVVAVYNATCEALARARRGEGPTLIEAMTLRFRGHYEGDGQEYRDKVELERIMRERDPILLLAKRITEAFADGEGAVSDIEGVVRKEVEASVAAALRGSAPGKDRLFQYLYA
jgi:acetoin:2,6-dichlorophenolindophenol oxidoreductase subunit alpha